MKLVLCLALLFLLPSLNAVPTYTVTYVSLK